LAESGEGATSKSAGKALGTREADAIALVGRAVQHLDSRLGHHLHQLGGAAAFIIVVAQHGNGRNAQAHYHIQQRFHLFRAPEVGQIASEDQHISFFAHPIHVFTDTIVHLRAEVQIGNSSNLHGSSSLSGGTCATVPAMPASRCLRVSSSTFSIPHSLTSMANIFSSTRLPRKAMDDGVSSSCRRRDSSVSQISRGTNCCFAGYT